MEIKWSEIPEDDGTYDLCGRHNGKTVDVMHLNSRWEFWYDNVCILDRPTRDEAKQAGTEWVRSL